MSSTGENEKNAVGVEQSAEEQPSKTVEKAAKVRKTKVPKEKKAKIAKTTSHPPYFQMIKEALLALREKGGSSPHAIAKYMEEKHKAVLPENFRKMLALQLKNSASKGKLTKIKASYKLSESGKKEKALTTVTGKKKPKQTKAKKPATATTAEAKKAAKAPKKAPAKIPAATKKVKKMTSAKPKQAKSIKSPAAKKARKVTA